MISFNVSLDLSIQLAIEPVQSRRRQRSRLFLSALEAYLDNAGCLDELLARTGATGSFFELLLDNARAGAAIGAATGAATRGAFLLPLGALGFLTAGALGAFLIAAGLGGLVTS